jgi:hypothetical protein
VINIVKGGVTADTNISYNKFELADFTVLSCISFATNGGVYDVLVRGNAIRGSGATVTNGFLDLSSGAVLAKGSTVKNNNYDSSNYALPKSNPFGLLANPFLTANNIVGLYEYGVSAPVASTNYYITGCDLIITSTDSGNSDCAIIVKDPYGNTIVTGLHTLTQMFLPVGYYINWGAFTGVAPTVTIWGN